MISGEIAFVMGPLAILLGADHVAGYVVNKRYLN